MTELWEALRGASAVLALALSALTLALQRRDRFPRVRVRHRYEYRAGSHALHARSERLLSLRLGPFLAEHGLGGPDGVPVVRFAVSNPGPHPIRLQEARILLRRPPRKPLVVDPAGGAVSPRELGATAPILPPEGVPLGPGDAVGYRFELAPLASALAAEGFRRPTRLALEFSDHLGRKHRRPFSVDPNLWAQEP
jgi:hypothetical protein